MAGSYGNSMVTFGETAKLCSRAAVPFYISQQQCVTVAISSLSPQHLLFSVFSLSLSFFFFPDESHPSGCEYLFVLA